MTHVARIIPHGAAQHRPVQRQKKVDAGAIIHQEKFKVKKTDSIENIVNKNYEVAFHAMIKAIDKLEKGSNDFIENDDSKATYNSIPSIKDAINYRFGKTFNNL